METLIAAFAGNVVVAGLIVALYKAQVKRIDQHDKNINDLYEKHNHNVERIAKVETEIKNHKQNHS